MEASLDRAVKIGKGKHPKVIERDIQYGTAGFRTKATDLDHVVYRIGLLAVLRSKAKSGASIGVMLTASHNPEEDNGVKLIDPMGEMLEETWEGYATSLVNVGDSQVGETLKRIIEKANIGTSNNSKAHIVFAKDTRPSGATLAQALLDGIQAMDAQYRDYGLLTTPQLHYMVRCLNTNGNYGQPSEEGYYTKLTAAFNKLRGKDSTRGSYKPSIVMDGANGVGAIKMRQLLPYVKNSLHMTVKKDGSQGRLNHNCGADFVKVEQRIPEGMNIELGQRCCSFDGDADRIVFFYLNKESRFVLLDGDKIATLVAGYLQELVTASGLQLDLGLVQTAYANGSSTDYITKELRVPVSCVATGVKHLHHRAQEFDIGIYFEANGHGTVVFSEAALQRISIAANDKNIQTEQREAAHRLRDIVDLINQTVGDAISDLLLVEAVLHVRGWSVEDWNQSYRDLPNRQLKVKVADRTVISTTDAERQCTSPAGLQQAVNQLVAKYPHGRSFVRPSGTEDVVRVYAEADTQANADQLAHQVSCQVYKMAGGTGGSPSPP